METDIILEADVTPAQVAELAVMAEGYGIRGLWTSELRRRARRLHVPHAGRHSHEEDPARRGRHQPLRDASR